MPVVDINPNNSGTIKLGLAAAPTDEYSCQVTAFEIQSVANPVTREGTFCAPPLSRNGASSYKVVFNYLQDWGATPSISEFLKDNDGKLVYFDFAPDVPDVPTVSGAFYAQAGTYGGNAGSSWVSSGDCAIEADYTLTAPVVADTATARRKTAE